MTLQQLFTNFLCSHVPGDHRAFCQELDKLQSSLAYVVYVEMCKVTRVPWWSQFHRFPKPQFQQGMQCGPVNPVLTVGCITVEGLSALEPPTFHNDQK